MVQGRVLWSALPCRAGAFLFAANGGQRRESRLERRTRGGGSVGCGTESEHGSLCLGVESELPEEVGSENQQSPFLHRHFAVLWIGQRRRGNPVEGCRGADVV